ncbi:MAG TPA: methyltransferase domain-containing protein [Gemmatimonadaceae bacterium]|nr:methyltransferase domain-containing protein [Gemmatimonadaceae bacterium]
MTNHVGDGEPGRRTRAIATSVSRIMRMRDALRGAGDGTAQPFLDIACGDGRLAALVSVRAARVALGVDDAPARRAAIPVVAGSGERLPFSDGAAAYVLMADVLRRAREPEMLLREALRVGRHGVILIDRLVRRRGDRLLLGALDAAGGSGRAARYWTERQWWELADRAGAQVTHWERLRDAYAAPASWLIGRDLHVVMVLEHSAPSPTTSLGPPTVA